MLIRFKNGVSPQARQTRMREVRESGGHVRHAFHAFPLVSAQMSEQAIASFRRRPDVAYVEEDVILHITADDAEIPSGVDQIDAEKVWPTGNEGAGVHVAILDTGIDYDHPDLAANVVGGIYLGGGFWDELTGKDGSTSPSEWNDGNGHGTHCAGIIAAVKNGTGVVGVAPQAKLHAIRVFDSRGAGYTSDVCQALEWCADPANGIDIVSMSFGGEHTASLQEACQVARNAGVLLIAAAGNEDGGAVMYPAAYDSVIAVSAIDSSDTIAAFSSTGKQIELAAPGVSIKSTYIGGQYATISGTSMACPHVTGAAALALAAGVSDVRTQLQATAVDLGNPGWDSLYGYGRVNAVGVARVVVEPPSLTVIEVSPGTAMLQVGQTEQFSAGGQDQYGDVIAIDSVVWSGSDDAVGTIDQDGLFTATASGTLTITATGGESITGKAVVTVQEAAALSRIIVSPSSVTLEIEQTTQFSAAGEDQYGDAIAAGAMAWDSSNVDVGTIDQAGVFTALAAGEATITATSSEGVVGQANVIVTEVPATPTMHVTEISFDSDVRSWGWRGSWCKVTAIVTVSDRSGAPVDDAVVTAQWSGAYRRTVSARTNSDGEAVFATAWIRNGGVFQLEVTDVAKTDWLYDSSSNAETTDSIEVP